MKNTLVLKTKHEYKNSIELIFEIADTSLICFEIDEFLKKYISMQRKKMNEHEFNVEHELLIKKDSLSSGYSVKILSDKLDKEKLSFYSCDIRNKILSLPNFKGIILITKDEGNCYLCETLYPKIMEIETRLRAIVNKIYMQIKGIEWKENLETTTKRANNKRDKGFDLNEILLETLVDLMFKININETNSPPPNLDNLSKSELIKIINNIKYKSLWGKFFPNIDLKIEYLEALIKIRNKVMHFKLLDFNNDYKVTVKNLARILTLLDKAEKQISGKKFKLTKELADSFNLLFQTIHNSIAPIQERINQMATSLQPIMESISKILDKGNSQKE